MPLRRSFRVPLLLVLFAVLLVAAHPAPPVRADDGQVRGYLDAHTHMTSYEAFGGRLMCGKPFDPDGIEEALRDCPDHAFNGQFAWFENFTRHGTPFGTHDPTGWPTFKDWPAWDSRTHQQVYYTWLERSWRAGQRILVNDLVANRQLCEIYPLKGNSCDEMDTIRLEAGRMRELESYIDARNGGAGKGWFRIVHDSTEARQAIRQGKLAVVLGIETSEPFGCRVISGAPQCTREDIDKGLDEVQRLGVVSMFACHKFDNALCGVRFDGGRTGTVINAGNFLGTHRFWQAETCTGPIHDNTIAGAATVDDQVAVFLRRLGLAGITLPLYPKAPHCNILGLTDLGAYMIRGMMKRHMIVEIDHMSAKAADQALDILENAHYSGVISSHSWTDPHYIPRIYALGGMATSYGHRSDEFVSEWKRDKQANDPRYLFGFGYGLDANGMGALPPPRPDASANPLRYPFASPMDPSVKLDRLRTGQRTWDLNVDGVANYGLVPDWLADMRDISGQEIIDDMARGAEAYLQMWHRAETATGADNLIRAGESSCSC